MKSSPRDTGARRRGQTTLDFAFGIGVFLLAVAFIFMFLPDVIAPFDTPGEDGDKIQAERTADLLAADVLVSDDENAHATTLDPECTDAFFSSTSLPDRCGFTNELYPSGELDPTALGLDSSTHLRVQLEPLDGEGTTFSVGESPPASRNVQHWSRLVSDAGQEYELIVEVW